MLSEAMIVGILGLFMCLASGFAGLQYGSKRYHDLVGELSVKADKVIVKTEYLEKARSEQKKEDKEFFNANALAVESEIRDHPAAVNCSVPTGLLNLAIDRANAALDLHGAVKAPNPAARSQQSR